MFLSQSFKKFLKENFQETQNAKRAGEDLFSWMEDIERGCGLDPNDTSNDPAFHHLIGNSWHCLGKND
jgi:hypothetical protein